MVQHLLVVTCDEIFQCGYSVKLWPIEEQVENFLKSYLKGLGVSAFTEFGF